MIPFKFESKHKPKWYQLRTRMANVLINLARRIKPGNPELMAYLTEQFIEHEMTGMAINKISWKEFYKEPDVKPEK